MESKFYGLRVKGTESLFICSVVKDKEGITIHRDLIQYAMLFEDLREVEEFIKENCIKVKHYETVTIQITIKEVIKWKNTKE